MQISWTHALRKIVINCYKYHGREDLLPTFADDEDKVNALISQSGDEDEDMELSNPPTIHTVTTMTPPTGNSNVSWSFWGQDGVWFWRFLKGFLG